MYNEPTVDKFIVFKIGDSLLALPMSDVLKVVNCPPVDSGGLRAMGLIQLGRHTIRVLDLHQQLSPKGLSSSAGKQPFLVIMRTPQEEIFGIAVDEPPNLMELPRERLRSLPQSERQSGALEMISHAAVISQEEVTTTILLLDLKRVGAYCT
jgi:purine-binding chemotaxis protein CheW